MLSALQGAVINLRPCRLRTSNTIRAARRATVWYRPRRTSSPVGRNRLGTFSCLCCTVPRRSRLFGPHVRRSATFRRSAPSRIVRRQAHCFHLIILTHPSRRVNNVDCSGDFHQRRRRSEHLDINANRFHHLDRRRADDQCEWRPDDKFHHCASSDPDHDDERSGRYNDIDPVRGLCDDHIISDGWHEPDTRHRV